MATYSNDAQRKQTQRSELQASRIPRGEAPDHTPPPKRSKALWRRTRRVLLVSALLLALLALTGFLYQSIASAQDASSYPAPGKLIDVGGYRLHLSCTGTARLGSPTVILEAGYGNTSLVWSKVQPGVASFSSSPCMQTSSAILRCMLALSPPSVKPSPHLGSCAYSGSPCCQA